MYKIKTTTGTEIELNDYQLKQYNLIMQAHGSVGLVRQKDKWLVYEPSKVMVVREAKEKTLGRPIYDPYGIR